MPHTLTQSIDQTHYITDIVLMDNKHTVTATQASLRAARPVLGQPRHNRKSIGDTAIHGRGQSNTQNTPTFHIFGPALPTLTQTPQGTGIPPRKQTSLLSQPPRNLENIPLHRSATIIEVSMQIIRPFSGIIPHITKGIKNNMIHKREHLEPTRHPILYNVGSPSHTHARTLPHTMRHPLTISPLQQSSNHPPRRRILHPKEQRETDPP